MQNNQRGFGVIETILAVMGVMLLLGVIGYVYMSNSEGSIKSFGSSNKNYDAQNFEISLYRGYESDDTRDGKYAIEVRFNDSFDKDTPCAEVVDGFIGNAEFTVKTESSAFLDVTQNKKPYDKNVYEKKENSIGNTCPAVVVLPVSKQIKLDKAWLENSETTKNIKIHGEEYKLTLDKQDYSLALVGEKGNSQVPYIPNDLGTLFTNPACITLDEIKKYAKQNNMILLEEKYAGIERKLEKFDQTQSNTGSPRNTSKYNQSLYVISNDFHKNLVKSSPNDGICKIKAGYTSFEQQYGSILTFR